MQPVGNVGAQFLATVSTICLSGETQQDLLSQATIGVQQAANPLLTVFENYAGMDSTDREISRTVIAGLDSLPEEMQMVITIGLVAIVVFGVGLVIYSNTCDAANE